LNAFVSIVYFLLDKFGGIGLLVVGILDSSFLFIPFGNDLLIVALTASHPKRMTYYAAMSAAGSVLGCSIVDWISRKGGEKGLQRVAPRQFEYVKNHIRRNIAWSLILASVMPPPFPFTAYIAAAAAFQYPRKKLLLLVAAARFFRFSMLGVAAILFGQKILQIAQSPLVRVFVLGLCVVTIIGSVVSVYRRVNAIRFRLRLQPHSAVCSETHPA
jgi:membrane protein YqaA with SNARE-associated domain